MMPDAGKGQARALRELIDPQRAGSEHCIDGSFMLQGCHSGHLLPFVGDGVDAYHVGSV